MHSNYKQDIENLKAKTTNLKVDHFLTISNYTKYLQTGNFRGGKLKDISGNKWGNVVTLYFQIDNITVGGPDVEIFRFKPEYKNKYGSCNYAVYPGYISGAKNVVYVGHFADSHFTMAIGGDGIVSHQYPRQVLCTMTYITAQ